MSQTALARPEPTPSIDKLRAEMEAAKRYVDSGLLPSGIRTPQQALTIMAVGRELGIAPTYALRNIHVIEGKPTCSAELLIALVRRAYGQGAIRVRDATSDSCTVEYREQGWDGISRLSFSLDDAKRAGLAAKPMWTKYPRAMLRSRAVSEAVRTAFPECIAGLYTPDELGASVRVDASGAVVFDDVAEDRPRLEAVDSPPKSRLRRWNDAWHAIVDGTWLDDEDHRHEFIRDWTEHRRSVERRTASLSEFLATATEDEAIALLDHVTQLSEAERARAHNPHPEPDFGPDPDAGTEPF